MTGSGLGIYAERFVYRVRERSLITRQPELNTEYTERGGQSDSAFPKPGLPFVLNATNVHSFWDSRGRLGIPQDFGENRAKFSRSR